MLRVLQLIRAAVRARAPAVMDRFRVEPKPGPAASRVIRRSTGHMPVGGSRLCLYAHYAASGRVSTMVLRQLELYTLMGFDVVFLTTGPTVPDADWDAVLDRCTLAIHRQNLGLDFGSWADAAALLPVRVVAAEELLLTNDSVLGPILPLEPVFAALRASGPGLFGLTESIQHTVHLQSYFLLARGRKAIEDVTRFLLGLRLTANKGRIIRDGELALSDYMVRHGNRVGALFGYAALKAAILADPAEVRRLLGLAPFAQLISLPSQDVTKGLGDMLTRVSLNPTHHLWSSLVRLFGFPFIKAELVALNPAGVSDAPDWTSIVPADSAFPVPELAEHIALKLGHGATP